MSQRSQEAFRLPPDALDAYPRAVVESSLEKLLASAAFRRSERHRRFMRHIVRAALDGRRDQLKELLLGIELFDRRVERYDPRTDPIVRVEAGRIRDKLARYYENEGDRDAFVFEIPVGSYLPKFTRRERKSPTDRSVESYAVMPFSSDGSEQDLTFATCLADQMINLIGQLKDVKVVGRLSSFGVSEQNLGINALGKLLNVTRVIDGSVQRQGRRLRCIAHVYRTRDGTLLWSQSFDSKDWECGLAGEMDTFAFQDHIAAAVLRSMSPGQPVPEPPATTAIANDALRLDRSRARDLVERASHVARRYDTVSGPQVIELFEDAIALDPDSATAHIALATACFHRATSLNEPGATMLPRVEKAVDRALAIDPTNSEALALRATVAFRMKLDWSAARPLFLEALSLSPHNSAVNYRYAFALICNGEFEAGLQHSRIALELDPLNLGLRAWSAQLLAYSRNYPQAMEEALNVLDLAPDHLYMNHVLGWIHLYRAEHAQAMYRFDVAAGLQAGYSPALIGRVMTLGLQGDADEGRRELDALLANLSGRYCPPYSLALAQCCLGDFAATDVSLDRAVRERDPGLCTIAIDPLFKVRQDDAAFVAWMGRQGLRSIVA